MEEERENGAHCLIVPYPITGHINPMLQFAKRLSHKRVRVTLALTEFLLKTTTFSAASVSLRPISDGFDDGGRAHAKTSDEYFARFQETGRQTLSELIRELSGSGRVVDCVVYDPFIPWVLDVAKGAGLQAAAFFTQSCAVDNIYHQAYAGELRLPLSGGEVEVPGLPAMKPDEMPSFIYVHGSYPGPFRMILDQFRNLGRADWIFINTFRELEEEVLQYWMTRIGRVRAVGPTIPSIYLDKRLQDDKEYGLTIFKPMSNICMEWLNQRQPRSVVYVSFGSLAELTVDQIEELACALTTCGKHFLWVIRKSEESKFPAKLLAPMGLVVSWCDQLEVLAHEAVGCFVTHCGWNSTLEALSLGVPIVAMPQWTDQSCNAKFVVDVWGSGVRARPNEKGLVRREEIIGCVESVMEGKFISSNATKWKEIARAAVDEGGTSDKNIEEFVSALKILKATTNK
ncbi:UDP-glycosyltransferase 74G1-like [Salvia miltiorrhiza]|uniref:UDP-glycosyltransferase 74G1-like n=1 Tax=Salvia miltiorrhiza TaxID=226208 RepID=UPI0025AD149D|nr:UDP-glycosyltransferase 74G1-like [Salvia miltiorrhiza]